MEEGEVTSIGIGVTIGTTIIEFCLCRIWTLLVKNTSTNFSIVTVEKVIIICHVMEKDIAVIHDPILEAAHEPEATPIQKVALVPKVTHVPKVTRVLKIALVLKVALVPKVARVPEIARVPKIARIPKVALVLKIARVPKVARVLRDHTLKIPHTQNTVRILAVVQLIEAVRTLNIVRVKVGHIPEVILDPILAPEEKKNLVIKFLNKMSAIGRTNLNQDLGQKLEARRGQSQGVVWITLNQHQQPHLYPILKSKFRLKKLLIQVREVLTDRCELKNKLGVKI